MCIRELPRFTFHPNLRRDSTTPLRKTRRVSEGHPSVDLYSRNTCSHHSSKQQPSCLRKVPALFQEACSANQTPASNYSLRLVSATAPQRLSIVSRLITHQLRHGPSLEFALVFATASKVDQYKFASPASISSLWLFGLRIRCLLLPSYPIAIYPRECGCTRCHHFTVALIRSLLVLQTTTMTSGGLLPVSATLRKKVLRVLFISLLLDLVRHATPRTTAQSNIPRSHLRSYYHSSPNSSSSTATPKLATRIPSFPRSSRV